MKNAFFLTTLLTIISFLNIAGQKATDQDRMKQSQRPWSFSMSYTPQITFSKNSSDSNEPYKYLLYGFNGRFDYRNINERVSISFGATFRQKPINVNNSNNQNLTQFEFPVQVNYHLNKEVNKVDPYLKTTFKLTYLKEKYTRQDPGTVSLADGIYYSPSVAIGIGTVIKTGKNFSFILESDIGYGIINTLPNRGYTDLLIGIRYNL